MHSLLATLVALPLLLFSACNSTPGPPFRGVPAIGSKIPPRHYLAQRLEGMEPDVGKSVVAPSGEGRPEKAGCGTETTAPGWAALSLSSLNLMGVGWLVVRGRAA